MDILVSTVFGIHGRAAAAELQPDLERAGHAFIAMFGSFRRQAVLVAGELVVFL